MRFFIDTANTEEIKTAAGWGLLDGVTTNPSLVSKEKKNFRELVKEICAIVDGPVSAEAVSNCSEELVKEAKELANLAPNVVVKIPMTLEGLKAVKRLSAEGVRTNVTLVFSPLQALLAAKAGASYASPFIGRLDDVSHTGMDLVRQMLAIFRNYDFTTEVIVASVRHPVHVLDAALAGAHIATIPFKVLEQLHQHPLTAVGIERFLKDWEKAPR